ncbi:MAG: hypothetical protein V4628_11625 [Pseudomonadota bacterium]
MSHKKAILFAFLLFDLMIFFAIDSPAPVALMLFFAFGASITLYWALAEKA